MNIQSQNIDNYLSFEQDSVCVLINPETLVMGCYKTSDTPSAIEIKNAFDSATKKQEVAPKNLMLRLLLTNRCNFSCTYCQMKKMTNGKKPTTINKESIDKILDKIKLETYDYITVHFSGGEPLLALDLIEHMCNKMRSLNIKNVRYAISTNGSLLNEKSIQVLKKYNVQTIVSIDGVTDIENKHRISQGKQTTTSKIFNGLNAALENDLPVGISMVYNGEPIENIIKSISYLKEKFDIKSVGFNYLHYAGFEKIEHDKSIAYMQKYAEALFEVYNYCRLNNIFEEQSNRIIEPIIMQKFRTGHCSSQSSQVTIMPNGQISPCKTFASANKDCCSLESWLSNNETSLQLFKWWHNRKTDSINGCSTCKLRGVCGGGCCYEAYVDNNTIMTPDRRYCVVPQYIMKKLITLIIKEKGLLQKNGSNKCMIFSSEELKAFLSSKDKNKFKLTASVGHFLE